MRFALLSTVSRYSTADLTRIAAACQPALAAVAAAWRTVYPDIAAPTVRVVEHVNDLTDADVPGILADSIDEPQDAAYHAERLGVDGKPHPYMLILADAYQPRAGVEQATWHEMAETLVDPHCTLYDAEGWAIEVCDPVQSDVVLVDGVTLSPFVTPAWFGLGAAPGQRGGPFDSAGLLTAAHTVHAGGYAMKQDGTEVTGDGYRHAACKGCKHCRRMKRRRAIGQRLTTLRAT